MVPGSGTIHPPPPFRLSSNQFACIAILYGLVLVYSSLVLGPEGLHYVPITMAQAWRRFLAIHLIDNASDQRPDWIANMMMTVPLAFFTNASLNLRGHIHRARRHALITAAICLLFILLIKYAQLFFPPRTVTLNYIIAQFIGAVLGVGLFRLAHRQIIPKILKMYRDGDGLVVVLGIYSLCLACYFLMPFDFTLSPDDLALRFSKSPLALFAGAAQPIGYSVFLFLVDVAASIPVGMFLAVSGRDQRFGDLLKRGFGLVMFVSIASVFVLSATADVISLLGSLAGIAAGIEFMSALKGKDLWKRHYQYGQFVPIAVPVYLAFAAFASGLLDGHWLGIDQAIANLDMRTLWPLWSLYIVDKAEAARHVVSTLFLYAPIGVMVWLRRGFWSRGGGFSAFLGFTLCLLFEGLRLLKPGLTADFTMPFVAAAGAAAASKFMLPLWKMFEFEAKRLILHDPYQMAIARAALFTSSEFRLRPQQGTPALSGALSQGGISAALNRKTGGSVSPPLTEEMIEAGAKIITQQAAGSQEKMSARRLARAVWEEMNALAQDDVR